jgi:AbrB family looped-hinge helix DNA binding protein
MDVLYEPLYRKGVMKEYESSVSPKGQVTIPKEVRLHWGIGARDRVLFRVEDGGVQLVPAPRRSALADGYRSIPALARALSDDDMTRIAAEEHAAHVAREGLHD